MDEIMIEVDSIKKDKPFRLKKRKLKIDLLRLLDGFYKCPEFREKYHSLHKDRCVFWVDNDYILLSLREHITEDPLNSSVYISDLAYAVDVFSLQYDVDSSEGIYSRLGREGKPPLFYHGTPSKIARKTPYSKRVTRGVMNRALACLSHSYNDVPGWMPHICIMTERAIEDGLNCHEILFFLKDFAKLYSERLYSLAEEIEASEFWPFPPSDFP